MPRPPKTDELILGELTDVGVTLDNILVAVSSSGPGGTAPLVDWQLVPGLERYVDVGKLVDVLVEEVDPGPPATFTVDATLQDGARITLANNVERPDVDAVLAAIRVTP